MSVFELTREQIVELKQTHLMFHDDEEHDVSYGELFAADELVSDITVFDEFGGYDFGADDFFCSAN